MKLLPPGAKIEDLKPSPISGIYEFIQGAEVSYLTADGKYFLDGNLYDMSTRENLTEAIRSHARLAMINAVPESQMLIFSPKNPQYTITVFTDVDCQYCRKLHSDMAELNKLGVRVRYLFYPRTGPNTESWRKAEVVWCSADRNEALTRAKAGGQLDMNKTCSPTPVAREFAARTNRWSARDAGDHHRERRVPQRIHAAERAGAGDQADTDGEPLARPRGTMRAPGGPAHRSRNFSLSLTPSHCLASAGASFISLITGHFLASSAFSCRKFS